MLVRSEGKREPGKVYIDSVHSDPGIELAGRQSGEYTIYDFPEVNVIQRWYLNEQGINATLINGSVTGAEVDLFISTTALDEVPVPLREKVFSRIKAKHILLVFHVHWGMDNAEYFLSKFPGAVLEPVSNENQAMIHVSR